MTDNEIIKAFEHLVKNADNHIPITGKMLLEDVLGVLNRQKAQIEGLQDEVVTKTDMLNKQKSEIERYLHSIKLLENDVQTANAEIERLKNQKCLYAFDGEFKDCIKADCFYRKKEDEVKSEAVKEFAEKITEIFIRYAHLHSHADCAEKDYIEAVDGTEIEMQSVWDVFTLKKYGLAEYEEMNRLQNNIELIEKGRLLTELEKDFKLLVKEMVGDDNA